MTNERNVELRGRKPNKAIPVLLPVAEPAEHMVPTTDIPVVQPAQYRVPTATVPLVTPSENRTPSTTVSLAPDLPMRVYTSMECWNDDRIHALALYCSDGRWGQAFDEFCHKHLNVPRMTAGPSPEGRHG